MEAHEPASADHWPAPAPLSRSLTQAGPIGAETLIQAWISNRKPGTVRAYRRDLAAIAAWCQMTPEGFAEALCKAEVGPAHLLVMDYTQALQDQGLAPATIARRLAALRSLTRLARKLGMITWTLDVEGPKVTPLRDSRGPGLEAIAAMLRAAANQLDEVTAARDRALVWLLTAPALRVSEIQTLDLDHIDGDRLWVMGKHRSERELVTMPAATAKALGAWLQLRPELDHGAVFVALDRVHHGQRLSTRSMGRIVRKLGKAAGVRTWPHGLRHTGITAALDLDQPVRAVARFARHRSVATTMVYDDQAADLGGAVAGVVAAHLATKITDLAT